MVYSCHIFIDSMALIVILVEYFERVYVKSSIRACIFKCMFIYLCILKREIMDTECFTRMQPGVDLASPDRYAGEGDFVDPPGRA